MARFGIDVQELLTFAPERGVLSVYVDLNPADRGEPWRTELRNGLREAQEAAAEEDHETRVAIEATTDRIREHFDTALDYEGGRARIGFVEVARKRGARESWHTLQPAPPWKGVARNSRPFLLPLIAMLDEGQPRGVAVVSSEQIRLLEWSLDRTEELDDFRTTDASPGHEHSAPDAERLQGSPLETHIVRFLKQTADAIRETAAAREWPEVLLIGLQPLTEEIARHLPNIDAEPIDHHDLISERAAAIGERTAECVARLNRERELALVQRIEEAAQVRSGASPLGPRGALGPKDVLEALIMSRVDRLALDGERDYGRQPLEEGVEYDASEHGGLPMVDRLIELAFETSARVTPVEGEAAERLEQHGGAAALLRF
jgi:hypothetical protein